MDTFHKLFIKVGVVCLLLGGMLGMLIGTGVLDPIVYKFAHVHLNLLGFVGGVIYGVAYHILPRFNGKPLKSPQLVKVHFFSSTVGLAGMIVFYSLTFSTDSSVVAASFYISGTLYLASMFMFAFNIMDALTDKPVEIGLAEINQKTSAVSILKKWPASAPVFDANGLGIVNLSGLGLIYRTYSIERLCKLKEIDMELFMATLKAGIKRIGEKEVPSNDGPDHAEITQKNKQDIIKRGDLCNENVLVGDLLKVYPETSKVFEKHYGESCFSCPGQAYESIAETASMHNAQLDIILGEVNEVIKETIKQ